MIRCRANFRSIRSAFVDVLDWQVHYGLSYHLYLRSNSAHNVIYEQHISVSDLQLRFA